MLATRGAGSSLTAACSDPGQHMDSSPRRYTMGPADVLPARAATERDKTRLGAIVQSHPNTSPIPSWSELIEGEACRCLERERGIFAPSRPQGLEPGLRWARRAGSL